ncbi:hypothetical protein GA707_06130 [Nostocoides sp. F2B08]|uniref:type IV toxin-antitoxin system AbiEi family antitoxin domain-containing protein n=1 Tax=Nostocoides sp. F2B08 TaxID=2653936 RepID=UPI001263B067|nr:type IV toxin-antitoxin system AbiEi family antitoxin domain-containing protein [Tetrasphaera sp. F2B08]KAB7745497.1 hypothetical protein GA707_06130 [Tetrasphaera sp. F2B08]
MTFAFELQAAALGGVFTRRDALAWGMSDNELLRAVRKDEITRLGYGVYAHGEPPATRGARHAALTRGILRARPRAWAAARSALSLHDLPLIRSDLETVVLCAPGRERYHRPGVITYAMPSAEQGTLVAGVRSVSVETAIFQTVRRDSLATAIVAADAALHRGLTSRARLERCRVELARLAPRGRELIEATDAKAESPGESLGRILIRGLGYQVESQVELRTPTGAFVGRVDLLVNGCVVAEFDGDVKYGGRDAGEALIAEKRREDALRALGYVVVRLTWSDLFTRGRLERILAQAMHQARASQGAGRG